MERERRSHHPDRDRRAGFPRLPAAVAEASRALRRARRATPTAAACASCARRSRRTRARAPACAVDPERVLVTSGTSPAMLLVLLAARRAGRRGGRARHAALPCYPNFVARPGAEPRCSSPRRPRTAIGSTPSAVRRALTPRTRAIVVGSPANPTGAVQRRKTSARSPRSACRSSPTRSTTGSSTTARATSRPSASADDVFVLDGFSKRYAMTGFRLGYVIAPAARCARSSDAAEPLHLGGRLRAARGHRGARARRADRRRHARGLRARAGTLLVDGPARARLRVPVAPHGAFYVFADARASERLARARVRPARARRTSPSRPARLRRAAEGYLRFSYATSEESIREGLDTARARASTPVT